MSPVAETNSLYPELDEVFARLPRSSFRRRFLLQGRELAHLQRWGLAAVLTHGERIITERLASANPDKDGRQTPWRNHPVFVAQHATATCCRGCLEKTHGIRRGKALDTEKKKYVLRVLER